jgi:large subunit ribosomal protein L4e
MAKKTSKKKEEDKKEPELAPGKVYVYNLEGEADGEADLPGCFKEVYRPDVIRRAVVVIEANRRQPKAPKDTAGMRHSVQTWGKGRGVARVQRLMSGSKAAQSPNNVGGRRAHPPQTVADTGKKLNRKEMFLAKLSALSATGQAELVKARGHRFSEELTVPVVVKDDFESIKSTKKAVEVLSVLGVYDDVERALDGKRIRAGRGKMRGRRYRMPRGPLVVLSGECAGWRSMRNIPGVDIATPTGLNASLLAPGGDAGRLMVITEGALKAIGGWSR